MTGSRSRVARNDREPRVSLAWALAWSVLAILSVSPRADGSDGNAVPHTRAAAPAAERGPADDGASYRRGTLTPLRLDADTAARLASQQSPAVIAAATRISSKDADLEAARRIWRPTLSLLNATNYGRGDSTSFQAVMRVDEPGVPSGFAEGRYMANTLIVSLPLYYNGTLFGRDTPLAAQADGNRAVAQEELNLQVARAANLAVKAYFNAALGQEQLELFQAEHAAKLKQLEIVRQRVIARQARLSDQLVIESALATVIAGMRTATSLYETSIIQLRSVLGLAQGEKFEIAPVGNDMPLPTALPELIAQSVNDHPKVRSQHGAVQVARGMLLQEKGNYAPTVNFVTSYTGATNLQDNVIPTFLFSGITLNIPIADFGQSDAKIRSKNYALKESEEQLEAVRSTVAQDLATAYHTLSAARELIPAGRKKLDQLQHEEDAARTRYDLGQVSLDKLLEDQYNVLIQKIALLSYKYAAWGAYADLISVAGKPYSSQVAGTSR